MRLIKRAHYRAIALMLLSAQIAMSQTVFLTFEWIGQESFLEDFEIQVLPHQGEAVLFRFTVPAASPCDPKLNDKPGARCAYIACLPTASYDLVAIAIAVDSRRSLISNRYEVPAHQQDPLCEDTPPALFSGFMDPDEVIGPSPELPPSPEPKEAEYVPNVVNLRCPFAKP